MDTSIMLWDSKIPWHGPHATMLEPHSNCLRVPACRRLIRNPIPLLLSILVLVIRECSAFAPAAAPQRPSRHGVTGVRVLTSRAVSTTRGRSSLPLASVASGGSSAIALSYAQKLLADSETSGRALAKQEQKWWAQFQELEEYKREFGDCNVPFDYKINPQLGRWVSTQRQAYKRKGLSDERIEALEMMGFEWVRPKGKPPNDANWWKRFGELEEYKHEHGDCNVPQQYNANQQLGKWVNHQRHNYYQNNLTSERIEALERIGFEWARPKGGQPDDAAWWKRFGELEEYKEKHGDCNVPINYEANLQLATWVMNQRASYHQFIDENWKTSPGISEERIEALNEIGFEWRLRERPEWDERYDELVAYKNQHGDTLVPTDTRRGKENKYCELAMWVNTQRSQYRLLQEGKHSQLTDERIEKLNDIGFVWDAHEAVWEERFAELVSYKEMHGDTLVRQGSKLGRWANKQRVEYQRLQKGKHSTLTNERIKKLDQIGFVWTVFEAAWEERFSELVEFKESYGHADVPKSWENQQLFWWISVQRREYRRLKEGKMTAITEERIERLESIGFKWVSKQTYQWMIRFGELRDFYDENGVGPVPQKKDKSLHLWTRAQKREHDRYIRGEKTNMDEERIKGLESIGFFDVYDN